MRLFLLALILMISLSASSQRSCKTVEYAATLSSYQGSHHNTSVHSTSRDTVADENIVIPVVIHVLYHNAAQNISDAQLMSQLKILNEDFRRMNADARNTPSAFEVNAADTKINFCLAQVNPSGYAQRGIIRKFTNKEEFTINDAMKFSAAGGDDAWDTRKYLNIWVCNMGTYCLGYATPPDVQADKDGIVIQFDAFGNVGNLRPDYNKGRTATHEVGHWLGLRHIWGDDACGDDGVFDTPQQEGYNNNCPSFPHRSTCSPNLNGDMFMNYMDYSNDGCMNLFTNGQKSIMRGMFAAGGPRNSFLFSFACDSSLSTPAPLPITYTPANIAKPVPTVSIFPNPAHQEVNFMNLNGYQLNGKTINIYNTSGMLVFKTTLVNDANKINVSTLASGIYYIKIGKGTDLIVLKLIKV